MIEVRLTNGDWAEAETPEDAMRCARTLYEDATADRYFGRARDLTATFVGPDGDVVASGVNCSGLS